MGASGGGNYHNNLNSDTATFNGNNGAIASTANTAAVTVTNASNWNYSNNYGAGGGGETGTSHTRAGVSGGQGIVVIRYPGIQRGTGGTINTVNGFTTHTFTSDGTYTA